MYATQTLRTINMKSIFTILFLSILLSTFTFNTAIAQVKGDIITLNIDTKVTVEKVEYTTTNKELRETDTANYLGAGIKFEVMNVNGDNVKLKAITFKALEPYTKKEKDEYQKKYDSKLVDKRIDIGKIYNNKIYTIKKSDFETRSKKQINREILSIGLLTLPFKARFQKEETSFDTEFNLNSTLNISFAGRNDFHVNVQIGAGIGTVGLNTSNSLGLSDNEATDVSTLTYLAGFMLQYNKTQVGLYAGIDHINNQSNYQWKSNGSVWVGFGIGYNIFNVSLLKKKEVQDNLQNQ